MLMRRRLNALRCRYAVAARRCLYAGATRVDVLRATMRVMMRDDYARRARAPVAHACWRSTLHYQPHMMPPLFTVHYCWLRLHYGYGARRVAPLRLPARQRAYYAASAAAAAAAIAAFFFFSPPLPLFTPLRRHAATRQLLSLPCYERHA